MPAKGSGVGRKRGGPQLVIRLSTAELFELKQRSDASGKTLSGYVRDSALAGWEPYPECSICRGRHPMDDRHPCE